MLLNCNTSHKVINKWSNFKLIKLQFLYKKRTFIMCQLQVELYDSCRNKIINDVFNVYTAFCEILMHRNYFYLTNRYNKMYLYIKLCTLHDLTMLLWYFYKHIQCFGDSFLRHFYHHWRTIKLLYKCHWLATPFALFCSRQFIFQWISKLNFYSPPTVHVTLLFCIQTSARPS